MDEYAIFFDNGVWRIMRRDEFGNVISSTVCPTLETAIMGVAVMTGAPVGLKLITKKD